MDANIMTMRPKGRYVGSVNPQASRALGICDKSQFVFFRDEMVKQMEWRGNRLVWTGFFVGKPFVDQPNEQLRPPLLKPDPIPVRWPRLPQGTQITWNTLNTEFWQVINYINWGSWGTYQDGYPAAIPTARLLNLEQGGLVSLIPPLNIGYYPPPPPIIPEDIRLNNLQSFRWVCSGNDINNLNYPSGGTN